MKKRAFFLSALVMVSLFTFAVNYSLVSATEGELGSIIGDQLQPVEDIYGDNEVTETTLAETIADIIKIVLGFLGIIFLLLILYAGLLWMTAAGNEEKVKKAKDIMVSAVIGVAIVMSAYAITFFVIDKLLEATSGSSTGLD